MVAEQGATTGVSRPDPEPILIFCPTRPLDLDVSITVDLQRENRPSCRVEERRQEISADAAVTVMSGLLARAYDFDHVTERRDDEHLDRFGKHRPADAN